MKTTELVLVVAAALTVGMTGCEPTVEDAQRGREGKTCDKQGATRACGVDDGSVQYCDETDDESSQLRWGPCLADVACEPGESEACFTGPEAEEFGNPSRYCQTYGGVPEWEEDACNTPLVLAFEPGPVPMTAAGTATFDISGRGQCITTDWPTAQTPWLAIDLDRSGSIDGGHELFGSGTVLRSGARARHGFAALDELDSNGDGVISARDDRFDELVLWSDHDGDRTSTLWELEPLAARGVESIDLAFTTGRDCDARGNCARERSAFTFAADGRQASGEVIDIYLTCQ